MSEVKRLVTPHTRRDLARFVRKGHLAAFNGPASLPRAAGIFAHLCLEQANGAKTNNENYGNVTASEAWRTTRDYFGMAVPPPDPPHLWFRSYARDRGAECYDQDADALDGVGGYLKLMGGPYHRALEAWDHGDFRGGVHELKVAHYMTAAEKAYADCHESIARWALGNMVDDLAHGDDRPVIICPTPDYDGRIVSTLTAKDIEQALAVNLASLQRQTAEDPLFAEHGDPSATVPE